MRGFGFGRLLEGNPPVTDSGYRRPSGFAWSAVVGTVAQHLGEAVQLWKAGGEAAPIPYPIALKLWAGRVTDPRAAAHVRKLAASLIEDVFGGVGEGKEVAFAPPPPSGEGWFSSVFRVKTARGREFVFEALYRVEPVQGGYDVYLSGFKVYPAEKAPPTLLPRRGIELAETPTVAVALRPPARQAAIPATAAALQPTTTGEKAEEKGASAAAEPQPRERERLLRVVSAEELAKIGQRSAVDALKKVEKELGTLQGYVLAPSNTSLDEIKKRVTELRGKISGLQEVVVKEAALLSLGKSSHDGKDALKYLQLALNALDSIVEAIEGGKASPWLLSLHFNNARGWVEYARETLEKLSQQER